VPIEQEFGPSGSHSESLGNRYEPCAQMPYWPPCWSEATPLQFAHAEPPLVVSCVGFAVRALLE
jgi:hypothetical protein